MEDNKIYINKMSTQAIVETRELKCCNPDNNFANVTPKWPKWFFERPDLDTF